MRYALICLICMLTWGQAAGQPPEIVEGARQALLAAFPQLSAAAPTVTPLRDAETTALGCQLIGGLPLAAPLAAHRLEFMLDGAPFAAHVSADGSLTQPCDERFPNLGAGVMPVARARMDSDGDGLEDNADACPLLAGRFAFERAGCPFVSDADRDGDGSPDARDHCPAQAGAAAADGCSLLRDEDGDAVPDHVDVCPADFGVIRDDFALGCPADGGGNSTRRREAGDLCLVSGEAPIYSGRADDAMIVSQLDASSGAHARAIIGRTAAGDWFQLASGRVRARDLHLSGACFNIPLVNPAPGGATGCFIRPSVEVAIVREAPAGKQVTRMIPGRRVAALGRNVSGDWLFFRAGWVSITVLELSGSCEQLPVLDPAKAAAGTIHFCPPGYEGLLRPRIDLGQKNARIASATLTNRLRAAPDIAAELIGEIPPRAILDAVLDGPACLGPHIWWQVAVDGQIGWTVESDVSINYYYLEPAGGQSERDNGRRSPADNEQPWSQRIIHSANAAALDSVKLLAIDAPRRIAWSPSGAELAILTQSGLVERYSYPDFAPIIRADFPAQASAFAYSPDGSRLAIGDIGGAITLVDLHSEAARADAFAVDEQAGPIVALAWSKAGDKLAAISGDEGLRLARRAGTLKLWQITPGSPGEGQLRLHFHFPYPLSSLAFSADDRLLAVTGSSSAPERAGLWIYDAEDGALRFSKALVPGSARVLPSPDAALGDFVYSSGDSLYQLAVDSGEDRRIYHQAGMLLPHFSFRPQVLPGAEALLALSSRALNSSASVQIVNALNAYAPSETLNVAPSALAFSPDGKALAAAEAAKHRVLILGVSGD